MRVLYSYWTILSITLIVSIFVSLSFGSQFISPSAMFNSAISPATEILFSIRLPRIMNAITVGALLSMAGLMIQNLVKNPLADPYILGLSGASASVQLLIIASGFMMSMWLFLVAGFIAAMASLILLIVIATHKKLNTQVLLLSGVVMAFAYGAVISLLLTISPLSSTKPMLYWLMGDLSFAPFSWYPMLILLFAVLWCWKYHKELDLLARGEFFALKSGVNVKKMNLLLLISSSLFTAMAVSMAGTIGFVGLVVPHIARLIAGNDHAKLIPLSALIGAIVLLLADTLARSIVAPIQLPVGIFTAMIGVPVFIFLMRKNT